MESVSIPTVPSIPLMTVVATHDYVEVPDAGELHACPKCPYVSPKTCNVKRHYLALHSDVKPFTCSMCSYRTVRSDDLTKHMERHVQDEARQLRRVYRCKGRRCEAKFMFPADRKVHEQSCPAVGEAGTPEKYRFRLPKQSREREESGDVSV